MYATRQACDKVRLDNFYRTLKIAEVDVESLEVSQWFFAQCIEEAPRGGR